MKTLTLFLFTLFLIFSGCKSESPGNVEGTKSNKIRVILDTDANNELDDQHAIAYMLFNGQIFNVEGITVNRTYNGGNIDKQFEEADRIVKLCDLHSQIKIYKGASGKYDETSKCSFVACCKPDFGLGVSSRLCPRLLATDQ